MGQMSPGPSGDVVPCPQVNGVCMEGKQHADVVAAIKAGGDETRLLVVDVLTDEFFKKCKVVPSEEHLAGGLGAVLQGGGVVPHLLPLCHLVTKPRSAGAVPKPWEVEVSRLPALSSPCPAEGPVLGQWG